MTVYIDSQNHLIADSQEELHAFAQKIGLRREWFQDRPRLWHYDVTTQRKRVRAFVAGAVPIHPRTAVEILRGKVYRQSNPRLVDAAQRFRDLSGDEP